MDVSQIDTFGRQILCIDDSKTQLALYKDELEGMYSVTCALAYQEAVASLTAARPDLIILDMEMPQVTGLEFLDILRYSPNYAHIPVIIVSGDNNPADVKEAFVRGAMDYVRKPYDSEELLLRIHRIFQLLSGPPQETPVVDSTHGFTIAQDHLVRSIADLAAAKDNENTKHLTRIGLYSAELAETVTKTARFRPHVSVDFVTKIGALAKLHDIGKVNVPDHILKKTGHLTDREFEYVKNHTTDGARTIDMIRNSFPDYAFLDFAHDIILSHHESWDGSGYPNGIAGEDIPLAARIVAIADTFDAVTTKRSYANPVAFDEACAIIRAASGTRFDPEIVDLFRFCHLHFKDIMEKNKD